MPLALAVFVLLITTGCVHRKRIDPVPFVPMNSCVLVTIDGRMLTYPPVAGHCLFAKKARGTDQ